MASSKFQLYVVGRLFGALEVQNIEPQNGLACDFQIDRAEESCVETQHDPIDFIMNVA